MEECKTSFAEKMLSTFAASWKSYAFGAALFCAALSLFLAVKGAPRSYLDHLAIKKALVKWEENPTDPELCEEVCHLLEKDETFSRQYGARVAQLLIGHGQFEKAKPYVDLPLEFLRKESPEHASFVETTLLIEKGSYQDALEKAIRLKDQMGREESLLYVHNLLRIATLQTQLENGPGAMSAWKDSVDFLSSRSDFCEKLLELYRAKNIDLKRYAESQLTTPS